MPAVYAEQFARLPAAFALLQIHPDGLALSDLAQRLGTEPQKLRAALLAFYTADLRLFNMSRPTVLEFLGPDGSEQDPNHAEIVRIIHGKPDELGVEYVDAGELGLIYSAAMALLEVEPDDEHLQAALDVVSDTLLGAPATLPRPAAWNSALEPLQDAAQDRKQVRIVYSRAWDAGVTDRVIDPYKLIQTRRGWEVDAGPPDAEGKLRTFLLSNIREFEVLDAGFELPADLDRKLQAQRTTQTVRVRIPHSARWAADVYAEQVRVVEDDELAVTLDLDLLPPVERRVGLLLLAAGEDASVHTPGLIAPALEMVRELLEHHRSY